MTFFISISFVIIFSTTTIVSGWEHRGPIVAREEPREYAAWYQMPQGAAAYPPGAYERAVAASAAASQYAGYPRPYSRSPDYYPETAITNNMVPSGRKAAAAAAGYYIPSQNTQDGKSSTSPKPQNSAADPNAELISAIKDVVRKFKASLDRTGVQDDVRQMSTQLESTWNDLRRGKLESWIERAHQMLADSVSEDDVKSLLESQKAAINQKIAKNPVQTIIPKEKPIKSSVIKADKINPKFNQN